MQLGMIGLGRMGANMVRRLMKGGHQCVVYDRSADTVKALAAEGAAGGEGAAGNDVACAARTAPGGTTDNNAISAGSMAAPDLPRPERDRVRGCHG